MTQPTLFDVEPRNVNQYGYQIEDSQSKPIARRNDPATSKRSAAAIESKLSDLEQAFMTALRSFSYPVTAQEVADGAFPITKDSDIRKGLSRRESIRKRAGELTKPKFDKQGGIIRPAQIRIVGERECRATGNVASVYEEIER